MKKLIINADDFGLSRSINRGIIELFCKGALTSTSLLVNMPGFDDAVNLIKENRSLGVGVHINVIRGKPISPVKKVNSLCRGDFFRGSILSLLGLPYTHREGLDEFARECRAQIEKALSCGIRITHVDSEKHIHIVKPFFEILLKIAKEFGILRIRCINETPYFGHHRGNPSRFFRKQLYAALYLSSCSRENKRLLDEYNLNSTEYTFGISTAGNVALKDYIWIVSNLKEGTTEMICHPGYIDNEWQSYPLNREKYYINTEREEELNLLLSPKVNELIKEHDVLLMSYGGL